MGRYEGLIQPIVVRRSGSHEQMVIAAARASVAAWIAAPDLPCWDEWLAGSFAKTVRRARPVEIEKIRPHALASAAVGDPETYAEAFALAPCHTSDLPREVSKLQVSGTDAPREGWSFQRGTLGPHLVVNADAGMSTGKTCAQVAHGLFAWALTQDPATLRDWHAHHMPFVVSDAPSGRFQTYADHMGGRGILIRDAGHTEVDPGTATVLATGGWAVRADLSGPSATVAP